MWIIFKVFTEFVKCFYSIFGVFLFWTRGMCDLVSQPEIKLTNPAMEGEVLNMGPPGVSHRVFRISDKPGPPGLLLHLSILILSHLEI